MESGEGTLVVFAVGLEALDQGPHVADAVRRPLAAAVPRVALGQQHGAVLGRGGHVRVAVVLLVPEGVGQVHAAAVDELGRFGCGHGGGVGDGSQGCRDEEGGGLHCDELFGLEWSFQVS